MLFVCCLLCWLFLVCCLLLSVVCCVVVRCLSVGVRVLWLFVVCVVLLFECRWSIVVLVFDVVRGLLRGVGCPMLFDVC